jgi:protein required for attachment to host cells
MTKVKIKQGEWVLVCDGTKALLLQNAGDEKFPNLQTKSVDAQENSPTGQQGKVSPAGAISSGGARGAVEQTDSHEDSERAFLEKLAARLDKMIGAGEVKSLVVVAPPRALGVLRHAYSPALRKALHAEIDKDFVKMPVHEIEKHLAG